jgi:hypothetical protein
MRELTGEEEDDASVAASGVNERDQRTMPPGIQVNRMLYFIVAVRTFM